MLLLDGVEHKERGAALVDPSWQKDDIANEFGGVPACRQEQTAEEQQPAARGPRMSARVRQGVRPTRSTTRTLQQNAVR